MLHDVVTLSNMLTRTVITIIGWAVVCIKIIHSRYLHRNSLSPHGVSTTFTLSSNSHAITRKGDLMGIIVTISPTVRLAKACCRPEFSRYIDHQNYLMVFIHFSMQMKFINPMKKRHFRYLSSFMISKKFPSSGDCRLTAWVKSCSCGFPHYELE